MPGDLDLVPFVDQTPSTARCDPGTQGSNKELATAHTLGSFLKCSVELHHFTQFDLSGVSADGGFAESLQPSAISLSGSPVLRFSGSLAHRGNGESEKP